MTPCPLHILKAAPGATTAMSNGAACPSGGVVVGSSQGNAVVASVAVKVEEQPAENNGSANPAVVPTEDEVSSIGRGPM